MLLAVLFVLGVANFAVNRAVMESRHPILDALPAFLRARGGRAAMVMEFAVLLAAMLLATNYWAGAAWAYGVYTALNLISAWLLFSDRH